MSTPLSSSDPNDLPNLARCFSCYVPPGMQIAVRNYITANIAVVATNPVCTAPSAPTGVSASNARVADPATQMNVRWLQPANSGSFITGYVIKWGTVSGTYTNSMNVPLTPKNFTVTGLSPGTMYFFVVQAFAFAGCVSANSNEASSQTAGGPSGSCNAGNTFAVAWAARVVANGGASPSLATQTAIANFQCGLITDGLDTLVYSWNTFVSDNLIAALTPQLVGAGTGSDPWINHGFVAGDLTVNGLTGDGVAKYLDTGLLAQTVWGAANPNTSSGLTIYLETNPTLGTTTCFVGSSDGSPSLQQLETFNGSIFCRLFDVGSQATIANALFTGYMSAQRTALNALSIYEANSGIAHHTLVTSNVNNGGNPATPIFKISVFAYNDNTGPSLFAPQTLGFVCLHQTGLSSAQSALFSVRVQTLMSALGRAI